MENRNPSKNSVKIALTIYLVRAAFYRLESSFAISSSEKKYSNSVTAIKDIMIAVIVIILSKNMFYTHSFELTRSPRLKPRDSGRNEDWLTHERHLRPTRLCPNEVRF